MLTSKTKQKPNQEKVRQLLTRLLPKTQQERQDLLATLKRLQAKQNQ